MTLESVLHPFEFFAASYLATLLIAVGCAYLGVFLALKRVVFLGVALAEISAAGIACALLAGSLVPALAGAGIDELALAGSVVFSLGGVAALAFPFAEKRISREGVVAVGYAGGAAAAILLVWKSAHDLEHVKSILAGSSLYVNDAQLRTLAAAFAAIAAVHALFRKEFVFCSFDPVMARTVGVRARAADLVLYVTIGIAIALALRTIGVLSVFGFLALPAMAGLLLARGLGGAFAHAVAHALIASALGLLAADVIDLPPGPATVAVLAALLAPAALGGRAEAFRRLWLLVEGAGVAAALALALVALQAHRDEDRAISVPEAAHARRERAARAIEAPREGTGTHAGVVHHAIEEIRSGDEHGVEELIDVLASDALPFDRSEAMEALRGIAGEDLGYDPDRDAGDPANVAAIRRWREWYAHVKGRLRYDRAARTFRAE